LRFRTLADEHGRIETIEMSGLLVLETAQHLKNELIAILNRLSNKVIINIFELEEMDLSGVQLLVAFIRHMDQMKVNFHFNWNLDEEQKLLFVNVGIGTELFMNN
jgi:anti-anti-sigma regulatory factor